VAQGDKAVDGLGLGPDWGYADLVVKRCAAAHLEGRTLFKTIPPILKRDLFRLKHILRF
jgi:hypothetical protein